MATSAEINAAGDKLASEITTAENNLPSAWQKDPLRYMPQIRQHMNRAIMRGVMNATNPPWQDAMATGSSDPNRATLADGWFNRGTGWCLAGSRRIPATGLVQLRGVLYTNTANTLIMTLPTNLRPAQNEYFAVTVNTYACNVYVWIDGVVAMDTYTGRTSALPPVEYLSLSGIQYEAQV